MMATKKKKAAKKPAAKIGGKGFGAKIAAPVGSGRLLEDSTYDELYAWLKSSSQTSLDKVAVADFDGLRGVMARQDIAPGEEIIAIPAPFAVDLGADGADVVSAAQRLLATRATEIAPAYEPEEDDDPDEIIMPSSPRSVYWASLPQPDSPDLCTPDFFSEAEMQMVQWPPLVADTVKRTDTICKALSSAGASDASAAYMLRWAVWAVQSRVLTVQGPPDAMGRPGGRKLLIPFIDMFNHKGGTAHYLTGRTDGMLKVKAGSPIRAGEQIFIMYGTPATANDEFVAHYGFHDPSPAAASADRNLVRQCPEALPALSVTTIAEDEALLAAEPPPPYREQLAIRLRLSLKRAAVAEGLLPPTGE